MTPTLARLASGCLLASCVQTGSVGSDTGRSDGGDPSTQGDDDGEASSAGDDGPDDPYESCKQVDTTGEPFPDSCTPDASDSQCMQCVKLVCCSALLSCDSYQACACELDCLATGGPPDVCTDACASGAPGCDLSGCGEIECEQLCA